MKKSSQDNCYLQQEGDAFFERNFGNKQPPELRELKKGILAQLDSLGVGFDKVLEFGCNYGDLLAYMRANRGASKCVGIEASSKAIEFGRSLYQNKVEYFHGTIADNPVNAEGRLNGQFDLVVIDDVFGWVSRETVFQSIANIDVLVRDGGYVFIRDFFPNGKVKNLNHHVKEGGVYNFKVPGSHAQLFLASGVYETVAQRVFVDKTSMSANFKTGREFESRWADTILKKSLGGYFNG